jgi:hypothetical protein
MELELNEAEYPTAIEALKRLQDLMRFVNVSNSLALCTGGVRNPETVWSHLEAAMNEILRLLGISESNLDQARMMLHNGESVSFTLAQFGDTTTEEILSLLEANTWK